MSTSNMFFAVTPLTKPFEHNTHAPYIGEKAETRLVEEVALKKLD